VSLRHVRSDPSRDPPRREERRQAVKPGGDAMTSDASSWTRRSLLQVGALAGGGLVLGASLPGALAQGGRAPEAALNAWLRISASDRVTIVVAQAEMGQGISTTLPAVLAEELGADWSRVELENALADPAYRNPRTKHQFTGNSESISSFFDVMRTMGAGFVERRGGGAVDGRARDLPRRERPHRPRRDRALAPVRRRRGGRRQARAARQAAAQGAGGVAPAGQVAPARRHPGWTARRSSASTSPSPGWCTRR
jgi:hypothetical protein